MPGDMPQCEILSQQSVSVREHLLCLLAVLFVDVVSLAVIVCYERRALLHVTHPSVAVLWVLNLQRAKQGYLSGGIRRCIRPA